MNVSIKTLECFKTAAEFQNLSKAAAKLFISQGQLSRIISDLEQTLGVPLFDRSHGRLYLNACGTDLYAYTIQLLNLMEEARQSIHDIYLHETTQITLTTNISTFIPTLLKQIKDSLPELNFRQIISTRAQIISQLSEEKVDFAICAPPLDMPNFEVYPLGHEYPALIYPDGHWLCKRPSVSLGDLIHEDLVCPAKGFAVRDATDEFFAQVGWKLRYIVETLEPAQVIEYVRAGVGLGLIPTHIAESDPFFKDHHIKLADVDGLPDNLGIDLGLSWKKGRQFTEEDQLFFDTVVDYFSVLAKADLT